MSTNAVTTTLLKKNSTTVYIGEQGKPPIITAGKLTPDLLFNFKKGAFSYFTYKDLLEDKKVSHIAGGLQDSPTSNEVKVALATATKLPHQYTPLAQPTPALTIASQECENGSFNQFTNIARIPCKVGNGLRRRKKGVGEREARGEREGPNK
ncbi:hypothetical protein PILCRDRAFT_16108 [Piloderma croceum F 1598]|uniref:Uncharacterized protein n=1 Tax=Piloderma croceum (strain F 1598) TaxID=765440 RepID=A0A0C3B592_PILCF|nr:hypothetical protein PILCRDRAFT_16108 [Piloderma croceum F 1598]